MGRLTSKLLEATPGIEPGYTVLQSPERAFVKPLMLTHFPHRLKKLL
jgi:hypothetical protein